MNNLEASKAEMKFWVKLSLVSAGVIGAGFGLSVWKGAAKWKRETDDLIEKLERKTITGEVKTVSIKDFDALPSPVARYFRFALKEGQPIIKTSRICHKGEFNLNEKWIPFVSTQNFSANPPAFIWDAEMRMNPLINVRVRDIYLGGKGSMNAKVLSIFSVMNAQDNPKLDSGALQRYLAEAVWFPTSLLPSKNLKWTAIDERKALATLSDSGVTVSLEFTFGETGEITDIFTQKRFYETKGEYKLFPWAGRFRDYQEKSGMMIPMSGEVEWLLPEGRAPYWKGEIVDARYDFVE